MTTAALLATLQSSIAVTLATIQAAIASADTQFTANPVPAAGSPPALAVAALTNQSAAMTQLAQLYQLNALMARMNTNTGTAIANGSTVLQ